MLWKLRYAEGLRIIWADAIANGQTVRRVFCGEGERESIRKAFQKLVTSEQLPVISVADDDNAWGEDTLG